MTAATQRSLMEYLTVSRFYLEINNNTRLLISKASGLSITIDPASEGKPIGTRKGLATDTQTTPATVSYQNITLEFVTAIDNDILLQWYVDSHPQAMGKGGRQTMARRYEASWFSTNKMVQKAPDGILKMPFPLNTKLLKSKLTVPIFLKKPLRLPTPG